MSGLRIRESRNRVIPLQSTRLSATRVHFFPLSFFLSSRNASPLAGRLGRGRKGKSSTDCRCEPFGGELRTLDRRDRAHCIHSLHTRSFPFFPSYPFRSGTASLSLSLDIPLSSTSPACPALSLVCLVFECTCETKGFSSRYTESLELLNPPLAAFSISRAGTRENKCRPLEVPLVTHLRSSYGTLIPAVMHGVAIFFTFSAA